MTGMSAICAWLWDVFAPRRRSRVPWAAALLSLAAGCSPGDGPAEQQTLEGGGAQTEFTLPSDAVSDGDFGMAAELVQAPVRSIEVLGNGVEIANGSARPSIGNHTLFVAEDFQGNLSVSPRTFATPPNLFASLSNLSMLSEWDLSAEPFRCLNDAAADAIARSAAVAPGSEIVRTFTIRNTGNVVLELNEPQLPSGFALTSLPAAIVEPGNSTRFGVRLDTDAVGIKTGTLHIGSTHGDFSFEILGIVGEPLPAWGVVKVYGNAMQIAHGSSIPDFLDHTDFGVIGQHGDPFLVTRTFVVCNAGNAQLRLDAIEVPDGFIVVSPPKNVLAAREGTTFQVQLDVSSEGTKEGAIRIAGNGDTLNPFSFAVRGIVTEAQPARVNVFGNERNIINGHAVPSGEDATDFGSAAQGGTPIVHTFTIRNTGGLPVQLQSVAVPEGFTLVVPPTEILAPGETADFRVRLDTAIPGTKIGTIEFGHDAVNLNPFAFAIRGVVTD